MLTIMISCCPAVKDVDDDGIALGNRMRQNAAAARKSLRSNPRQEGRAVAWLAMICCVGLGEHVRRVPVDWCELRPQLLACFLFRFLLILATSLNALVPCVGYTVTRRSITSGRERDARDGIDQQYGGVAARARVCNGQHHMASSA
jgi:hypothetical protein